MTLQNFPSRIFLDSSTLQTLQDYGQTIYDGEEIPPHDRLWHIPKGIENIVALRKIMHVGARGALQLAISHNSLQEVLNRGFVSYLQWALEIEKHWENYLATLGKKDSAKTGKGAKLASKIIDDKFGYLSSKDLLLIKDAIVLECDVFLTMEQKLPKNADHLEKELKIKVMQPFKYWQIIKPWSALFR